MVRVIGRGDVWLAVWPNDPRKKPRPVLVVSNRFRNHAPHILDVVVVKLTSEHRKDGRPKPINAAEDIEITLKKPSLIRCGSIYTLPKSWLKKKLSILSRDVMSQVDQKLLTVLDLRI